MSKYIMCVYRCQWYLWVCIMSFWLCLCVCDTMGGKCWQKWISGTWEMFKFPEFCDMTHPEAMKMLRIVCIRYEKNGPKIYFYLLKLLLFCFEKTKMNKHTIIYHCHYPVLVLFIVCLICGSWPYAFLWKEKKFFKIILWVFCSLMSIFEDESYKILSDIITQCTHPKELQLSIKHIRINVKIEALVFPDKWKH